MRGYKISNILLIPFKSNIYVLDTYMLHTFHVRCKKEKITIRKKFIISNLSHLVRVTSSSDHDFYLTKYCQYVYRRIHNITDRPNLFMIIIY